MKAREILSPAVRPEGVVPLRTVEGTMPVLEVLPRLLDTPGRELGVVEGSRMLGVIDQTSMLEGLGRMIVPRDDCSVIVIECAAGDYSASHIARAVEDTDVHLVDLFSAPAEEGKVRVTLRARCLDPAAASHSLERYGYSVVETSGDHYQDGEVAMERLLGLQSYLNV